MKAGHALEKPSWVCTVPPHRVLLLLTHSKLKISKKKKKKAKSLRRISRLSGEC